MDESHAERAPSRDQPLSTFLRTFRSRLLQSWRAAVQRLPVARDLDDRRLLDHLPQIFDRIIEMVEDAEAHRPVRASDSELDAHAIERLDEGYSLESVVNEFAVLRECILGLLAEQGLGGAGIPILNRAIDDAIGASISRYIRTHQRALIALDRMAAAHNVSGDLDSILNGLLRVFLETTEAADTVTLFLRERSVLRVRATIGMDKSEASRIAIRVGEGFVGKVAASRAPLEIRDASTDPIEVSAYIKRSGVHALYGVPMMLGDQLIGVAKMGSRTAYEFADDDKVLFRVMVERATTIIAQSQLMASVTEARMQAEGSLALVDALFASAPIGFVFFDRDLRYIQINETLAQLNGMTVAQLKGRTIREVLPRDADFLEPLLRRVLETGEPVTRMELTRPSGHDPTQPRHWLFKAFPVRSSDGTTLGVGGAIVEITERKQAEEATKRSEARFRSLVLATAQIVWTTDAKGNINEDSPSYRAYTGVTRERYLQGKLWDYIHPDDQEATIAAWKQAIKSGRTSEHEYRLRRFDGVYRHFLIRVVPVLDEEHRLVEWVGACIDIHEQKRAQLERQKRTAELEAVIASIPDAVYVGNEKEVRTANELALSMLGLDRLEELNEQFEEVGKQIRSISDNGSNDGTVHRIFDHALEGRASVRELLVRNRRTNETRTVRSACAPIQLKDEQIIGAVTVNTDITEQKEAELRAAFLDEAATLLSATLDDRTILERLSVLVVPRFADWCLIDALTEDGLLEEVAITHADPTKVALVREWRRRFPPDPDSPLGAPAAIREGTSRLIPELTDDMLQKYAQNEEHLQLLRALQLRSVLIVPLRARGQARGTLTLCRSETHESYDAADRAFAEELARRAALAVDNAQLYRESQEALRARDELLSVAAHDLRSPLSSLALQLHTLLRQTEGERGQSTSAEELRPKLSRMDQQLRRVTMMLEELLDISRIHAGRLKLELEPMDLTAVVRDVLARHEEAILTAGCSLTAELEGPLEGVWDHLRLEQVVTNLVSNAIKYGRGTPIEVRVSQVDNRARLVVRDRGVGIAPEHHEAIFRRFERVGDASAYKGTGLGLWIVRRIVEALHGHIHVESEIGAGSTFVVELPLAPDISND